MLFRVVFPESMNALAVGVTAPSQQTRAETRLRSRVWRSRAGQGVAFSRSRRQIRLAQHSYQHFISDVIALAQLHKRPPGRIEVVGVLGLRPRQSGLDRLARRLLLALVLALVPQPSALDHETQGQALDEDRPDDGQRRDCQDQVALGKGLPVS